ncbi:MAG: tRNA/rRNA methyltransferase [Alphaproteobacteria bacterium]|jgi:tRNA/rRNA methyltransferase
MPPPERAAPKRPPRSRKAGKAGAEAFEANGANAGSQPVIILDHPQLGENIGFAARAMLNCGLVRLRLVTPRAGWPNERAVAAAAGATNVLDAAVVHKDMTAAVGDLTRIYATTARPRDMRKPVMDARAAAADMAAAQKAGAQVGIVFGRERTGLDNEDVSRADVIVEVPLNPEFSSLNLGQAVLLVAYEWRMAMLGRGDQPGIRLGGAPGEDARQEEIAQLFAHLEGALDTAGYFFPPEKAPRMKRNLRTLLLRGGLNAQEVRSLRGVIKALTGVDEDKKKS